MRNIIFCDIDGTILDGTRGMYNVSFKTRYAFRELMKQGDLVVIASGRNKGLLNDDVWELEPSGFVLCNGSYAEFRGEPVYSKAFDPIAVEKIKEITLRHHGFYILEDVDRVHIDSFEDPSFKYFMSKWGLDQRGFIEKGETDGDFHIAMIGFLERETGLRAIRELQKYADVFPHNSGTSFDVNVKGINKGVGVKEVIRSSGVAFENTYCFGDGINDLEMLESVYHPVMMANSNELLKSYDFEKTDDVLHDGLYNYLVLNKLIKAL